MNFVKFSIKIWWQGTHIMLNSIAYRGAIAMFLLVLGVWHFYFLNNKVFGIVLFGLGIVNMGIFLAALITRRKKLSPEEKDVAVAAVELAQKNDPTIKKLQEKIRNLEKTIKTAEREQQVLEVEVEIRKKTIQMETEVAIAPTLRSKATMAL